MGGSSKEKGAAIAATAAGTQPSVMSFSIPDGGATIASQLQQGGLLNAIGNPGLLYKPVDVPILNTPADLRGWMLSNGMSYVDDAGKSISAPKSGGSPAPSTSKPTARTGTQPKINVGGR